MSRKLDMAIAEALGYEVSPDKGRSVIVSSWFDHPYDGSKYRITENLPKYSTDGNAMLELDAAMGERGYSLLLDRYFVRPPWERNEILYVATYYPERFINTVTKQYAKTEPLARALAAYYALTGKAWEEDK